MHECTCVFPAVNQYDNGVCDKCGGKFLDSRDLRPIETVTTYAIPYAIKGEKTHILSTKRNKEAIEFNKKYVEEWES